MHQIHLSAQDPDQGAYSHSDVRSAPQEVCCPPLRQISGYAYEYINMFSDSEVTARGCCTIINIFSHAQVNVYKRSTVDNSLVTAYPVINNAARFSGVETGVFGYIYPKNQSK